MKFTSLTIKPALVLQFSLLVGLLLLLHDTKSESLFNNNLNYNSEDTLKVTLVYQDTLTLPSFTEFTLPVKMKPSCEISAISMGFYFPDTLLEITDVELAGGATGYHNSVNDSLFRITWSNPNPIAIVEGDTLLTLKMKTLDLSALDSVIKFSLYEMTEFADPAANIIEDVILDIPAINYLRPDTIDTITGYYVKLYPNPFDNYTTVYFGLKDESRVKITVTNLNGSLMMVLTDKSYPEGDHQVRLNGLDLSKGVYMLKTEIRNEELNGTNVYKIMNNR